MGAFVSLQFLSHEISQLPIYPHLLERISKGSLEPLDESSSIFDRNLWYAEENYTWLE
jgi:hypothetical protein